MLGLNNWYIALFIGIVLIGIVVYLNLTQKEDFIDKSNVRKYRTYYRKKGGWDQGYYEHKIPFHRVSPKNTKCELLKRFYGGNQIIQFNEYLTIIDRIYETISEHRALDKYKFGPMKTSKLCSFNIDEEKLKKLLTNKINEINYNNKILYDGTCENFVIQEPKLELSKCKKTGAILINYYFTLYHPKRETSINSVAQILIDEDKKLEIVKVKSAVQFSGEYNGYEKHTTKDNTPFEQIAKVPVELCWHRQLDKLL